MKLHQYHTEIRGCQREPELYLPLLNTTTFPHTDTIKEEEEEEEIKMKIQKPIYELSEAEAETEPFVSPHRRKPSTSSNLMRLHATCTSLSNYYTYDNTFRQ